MLQYTNACLLDDFSICQGITLCRLPSDHLVETATVAVLSTPANPSAAGNCVPNRLIGPSQLGST